MRPKYYSAYIDIKYVVRVQLMFVQLQIGLQLLLSINLFISFEVTPTLRLNYEWVGTNPVSKHYCYPVTLEEPYGFYCVCYKCENKSKDLRDSIGHPVGSQRPHHTELLKRRLVLPFLREFLFLGTFALDKLLPTFGGALDVAIQVAEFFHGSQGLWSK